MSTELDSIIKIISHYLTENHMTKRAFAKRAGLSEAHLGDILRRRSAGRLEYKTIYGIAKVMRISTETLLGLPPLTKADIKKASDEIIDANIETLLNELKKQGFTARQLELVKRIHEQGMDDARVNAMLTLLKAEPK